MKDIAGMQIKKATEVSPLFWHTEPRAIGIFLVSPDLER
ncbi:hypothetical protein Z950_4023 [Sulfitobacter mediterraneus KCTC 32188]|nr:hypothetical protein Z950_4023 [Sulfitobacter mediterraneus KCTC 32188]